MRTGQGNGNDLGSRLKELRKIKEEEEQRKIPQREVAEALSVTKGAYGSWESGRTKPDILMLPKIANYFEVSIDALLGQKAFKQLKLEPIHAAETDIAWSRRCPALSENEEKGIECWQQFVSGKTLERIVSDNKKRGFRDVKDVEQRILDVLYADIVRIIELPLETELAEQVRQVFNLRNVIVMRFPIRERPSESDLRLRTILLGEIAGSYLKKRLTPGMKVGVAGGYSVSSMFRALRRGECYSLEVYPLGISPSVDATTLDTNSLIGSFAYRHYGYNVSGYTLPYTSPLAIRDADDKKHFFPTLRILAKARSIDIAFMGIGGMTARPSSYLDWVNDLADWRTTTVINKLKADGAVGDVLYHFIDKNGKRVPSPFSDLICSIGLDDLQEMVREYRIRVVTLAVGRHKVEVCLAAINANYTNVLIIDDDLAQALLEHRLSSPNY